MNKHSRAATILSIAFMGLGQLYNRQIAKGLFFLAIGATGLALTLNRFSDAIWGLFTLGDTPRGMKKINGMFQPVDGDHSIFLMVEGLIALLCLFLFIVFYFLNIRDARVTGRLRDQGHKPEPIHDTIHHLNERHFPYVILLLPFVAILFLTVLPLIFSVLIAFTDYAAPNLPPANLVNWNGFDTFNDLITLRSWSRTFFGVLAWTGVWAVFATATTYVGGIFAAVLVSQKGVRFRKFWRTMLIVPFAIPNLVSLLVFRNLLNSEFGPINQYLEYFGLQGLPWLTDPTWARITVILVNAWLGIPVTMILVSGILTTIPRELYEAAEVDGASPFQAFRMITMPMVFFATAPILIMQFAGNINNFNVIFLLTDGNPIVSNYQYAGATDLLVTWLYKLTLNNRQYNFSSVIGIIIFILIASLSIYNFRKTRSYKEEDMIQ